MQGTRARRAPWQGPGRLHLVPHVNAPVADLPVRRVIGAHHFVADLTLPYGKVAYDYMALAEADELFGDWCGPPLRAGASLKRVAAR